jgi:transposase
VSRAIRSDKWQVASEKQLKEIESMAGIGLNYDQISTILGISPSTFDRRLAENDGDNPLNDAVQRGRAKALSNVSQAAYNMAIKEKQPTMTQFWLRCKGGWKDTQFHEVDGKFDVKSQTTQMTDQEALEYVRQITKK